ncbi:MAG TPA: hypothetical protein VJV96_08825 [Candidatus Angelobacter sp.]|jgi:DNA-binding phage protein|nr:hypothetical protein [Candidatus Angelobacter sp.]
MTPLQRLPVLLLLLSALTVISGCARKKPVVVVVPREQPPITAPTPAPTPEAKTEEQKPETTAQAPEQTENQETAKTSSEGPEKKSHHHQRGAIKKPSPVVKAENTPPETRPPEPRSTPAPISPSISPTDAQRDQYNTEQLLQTTENALNNLKRQLSKEEEAMVAQARSYINQSRQASKDNDPARARTLAQKANLLSNELVRR